MKVIVYSLIFLLCALRSSAQITNFYYLLVGEKSEIDQIEKLEKALKPFGKGKILLLPETGKLSYSLGLAVSNMLDSIGTDSSATILVYYSGSFMFNYNKIPFLLWGDGTVRNTSAFSVEDIEHIYVQKIMQIYEENPSFQNILMRYAMLNFENKMNEANDGAFTVDSSVTKIHLNIPRMLILFDGPENENDTLTKKYYQMGEASETELYFYALGNKLVFGGPSQVDKSDLNQLLLASNIQTFLKTNNTKFMISDLLFNITDDNSKSFFLTWDLQDLKYKKSKEVTKFDRLNHDVLVRKVK